MEPPPFAMMATLSSLVLSPSSEARSIESSWVRVENSVISVHGAVMCKPAESGEPTFPSVVGTPTVLAGTTRISEEPSRNKPSAKAAKLNSMPARGAAAAAARWAGVALAGRLKPPAAFALDARAARKIAAAMTTSTMPATNWDMGVLLLSGTNYRPEI